MLCEHEHKRAVCVLRAHACCVGHKDTGHLWEYNDAPVMNRLAAGFIPMAGRMAGPSSGSLCASQCSPRLPPVDGLRAGVEALVPAATAVPAPDA